MTELAGDETAEEIANVFAQAYGDLLQPLHESKFSPDDEKLTIKRHLDTADAFRMDDFAPQDCLRCEMFSALAPLIARSRAFSYSEKIANLRLIMSRVLDFYFQQDQRIIVSAVKHARGLVAIETSAGR